jgi:hypothetical protein
VLERLVPFQLNQATLEITTFLGHDSREVASVCWSALAQAAGRVGRVGDMRGGGTSTGPRGQL